MGIRTLVRSVMVEKEGTFLLRKDEDGDLQLSVICSIDGETTTNPKQLIHVPVTTPSDKYGLCYNGKLYSNIGNLNAALKMAHAQCQLNHPYDPNDVEAIEMPRQTSLTS